MTVAVNESTKISAASETDSPSSHKDELWKVLVLVCVGLTACAVLAWIYPDFPLLLQDLPVTP